MVYVDDFGKNINVMVSKYYFLVIYFWKRDVWSVSGSIVIELIIEGWEEILSIEIRCFLFLFLIEGVIRKY